MQVTFRDQRVKTSLRNQAIHTNAIVFPRKYSIDMIRTKMVAYLWTNIWVNDLDN